MSRKDEPEHIEASEDESDDVSRDEETTAEERSSNPVASVAADDEHFPDPSTQKSSAASDHDVPWADRWWVWALGGIAFALFILLMHVTS